MNRWRCSTVVTRCLSCQRQSLQSASGTSFQNPRPAGWNSLSTSRERHEGGSLSVTDESSLCIFPLVKLAHYRFDQKPVKPRAKKCYRHKLNSYGIACCVTKNSSIRLVSTL